MICPECGEPAAVGLEYRGVYDGVLAWECASGHWWPRFPRGRLYEAARQLREKDSDGD